MKFGEIDTADALGAILAHSVRLTGRALKKGRVLERDDIAALLGAGHPVIAAARLEADDVHEDEAARRVAAPLCGDGLTVNAPFTGRVNLYAAHDGILRVDAAAVARLNAVDEAITLATLAPWAWVDERQLLGTVKIIPFSAPGSAVAEAARIAASAPMAVARATLTRIGLIQTLLPDTRAAVLDKTTRVLGERARSVGAAIVREARCAHRAGAVAGAVREQLAAGCEMVLIAGASAIVDRRDVVPSGIEAAGGEVIHFGMPVDPGNLVLMAAAQGKPVVGLPGCARSPAFNGFDWVLQRLAAGIEVGSDALTAMGAGGLLKEGAARPSPREVYAHGGRKEQRRALARAPRIAALVLAAGQSRRMGERNKLAAALGGSPMVRHSVQAIARSKASPVVVVTGFEPQRVTAALADLAVRLVHNPAFGEGLSTSLAAGIASLEAGDEDAEGVVVCLADMPLVAPAIIDQLIAAYDPVEGREICVPAWRGKRGNPVLFGARFFAAMRRVKGDVGARHLLSEHEELICEVAVDDHCILEDVDSPPDLERMQARFVGADP
ncbi:MAG: NTP transferase domain-containing protein [Gammaproteobacteria bacterium]|nr:NTP transferase domain-containing protein [Gammaproteobacteria bacterium]